MDHIQEVHHELQHLCTSIQSFIDQHEADAKYRAPVLYYRHPDDYQQQAIQGLTRFLRDARHELAYVDSLLRSSLPPRDFTTNAPHLVAVWDQFVRAAPPLVCISQVLDSGQDQIKLDVVATGGNEWIKVNTVKESRLMSEFREQDSYINSDYDSDSSSAPQYGSTQRRNSSPELSNSIVRQAKELIHAARTFPRPSTLPEPTLTYVLARMAEHCDEDRDPRIQQTFDVLRGMGVHLIFSDTGRPIVEHKPCPTLTPRRQIILDLSVVVALCCDSTHHPLPCSEDELETRFRPRLHKEDGTWELGPHSRTSRDLRDQLRIETDHPLVEEMQARLADLSEGGTVDFWVTQEVKDRLPGIVGTIGGDQEKARGLSLFGQGDFWAESRYRGNAGVLSNIRVRVLDLEDQLIPPSPLDTFDRNILAVCTKLIEAVESPTPVSRSSTPNSVKPRNAPRSSMSNRPETVFHSGRWPSAHTLRTIEAGIRRGMTVLTNNRGAVGKVIREMGATEGLPYGPDEDRAVAKIWVVNPSSLAEWRRVQVEQSNGDLSSITQQSESIDDSSIS